MFGYCHVGVTRGLRRGDMGEWFIDVGGWRRSVLENWFWVVEGRW